MRQSRRGWRRGSTTLGGPLDHLRELPCEKLLIGVIDTLSPMPLSPKTLAFVGLVGIWPSGLAATPRQWFKRKNISAIRLTTPGVSTEGSIGLRQRSRVSTPIALVALPGDSGGALRARPEQPPVCARPNERLNLAALARLAFPNRDPHVANMSIDSKRLTKD